MRRSFVVLTATSLFACQGAGSGASQGAAGSSVAETTFDSGLSAEDQEIVVAQVGDLTITLKDFERRLMEQQPYARARYASAERKREFLENLVRFEVLAAEAAKRGYDRHPEVVQQLKQSMVRKLMVLDLQNLVKLGDITEAEMKKYYDDNADTYHKPEQVRVSQVLWTDEGQAKKQYTKLKSMMDADRKNYRKIFRDFAREHSEDATTKARGGDLRFFARKAEGGTQPEAVSTAAFALKQVGDLAPLVRTDQGWHALLLTGKKNRYDRTFEQVKRQIQNRLFREKKRKATDDYVEALRSKSATKVNADALAKVTIGGGGTKSVKSPTLGPIDPTAATPPAPAAP